MTPPARTGQGRGRVLIVGGCDVHLRIDLMRALARRFTIEAAGSEKHLRRHFDRAGFEFFFYPLGRGTNPLRDLWSTLRLLRLFRQVRPDLVHAFATKPCVWGRLAARWAGVPCIVGTLPGLGSLYTADTRYMSVLRRGYQLLQRWASHISDATIFQNHDDATEFVQAGITRPEKIAVVLGSGVRTDFFDPSAVPPATRRAAERELRPTPDAVVITMVSRVIRSKGVLQFADAAERVRSRYPSARFVLVGPDDRDSLDALTAEEWRRIDRHVVWLGGRDDVRAVLCASDIFVLPSFYREGIPRVLLEAASMGLPLVTTLTSGCREVVDHGVNGFLVPPRDSESLADAIRILVERPDERRRFGDASRVLAIARFDLQVVAERTAQVYEALLERRPLPAFEHQPRRTLSEYAETV